MRCKRVTKKPPKECEILPKLDCDKLAENLVNFKANISSVYISSPPSEEAVILKIIKAAEKLRSNASNEKNVKFYFGRDLINFLDQNYQNCDYYQKYQGEVISFTEQAILSKSRHFLFWSMASSWSKRINDRRREVFGEKFSSGVMDLLERSVLD